MAAEVSEPAPGEAPPEWAPPRELVTLLAALLAMGSAALVVLGVPKKWTSPTLGVLLLFGLVEAAIAIGLSVRCALAERRNKAIFIPATVFPALGTIALAAVLLLSGII